MDTELRTLMCDLCSHIAFDAKFLGENFGRIGIDTEEHSLMSRIETAINKDNPECLLSLRNHLVSDAASNRDSFDQGRVCLDSELYKEMLTLAGLQDAESAYQLTFSPVIDAWSNR